MKKDNLKLVIVRALVIMLLMININVISFAENAVPPTKNTFIKAHVSTANNFVFIDDNEDWNEQVSLYNFVPNCFYTQFIPTVSLHRNESEFVKCEVTDEKTHVYILHRQFLI